MVLAMFLCLRYCVFSSHLRLESALFTELSQVLSIIVLRPLVTTRDRHFSPTPQGTSPACSSLEARFPTGMLLGERHEHD